MIAFGSAITKPEVYRQYAEVGIRLAAEPSSQVLARASIGSIFASYNALLDEAAGYDDLEALVIVHQDAEIVDSHFCETVRRALSDSSVGVVGCVGAIDVRSIAWWEGSVTLASFVHRYPEHGGGDLPAFSWVWDEAPPYARIGEVNTLDGFVLAISPWAVHNLRFDESLGQFHGYDFDFCLQVRATGRKVITAHFRAVHHHPLEPFSDPEPWITAHMKVAEKWEGRIPGVGTGPGSWEERALRAEAGRDAARVLDHSNLLDFEARARELEHALAEMTGSISWRITSPLRRMDGSASGGAWRERLPLRARLARVDTRSR